MLGCGSSQSKMGFTDEEIKTMDSKIRFIRRIKK